MKKKILAIFLVLLVVISAAGCSKNKEPQKLTNLNLKVVKEQDLGNMMPKILFAHEGKIAFWGSFGLFIVNGEDGNIDRAVNLERIGYNHMTGEVTTAFAYSEDYKKIYFYNEDVDGNNVEDFYYYYDIDEDTVRQVPKSVEIAIMPDQPMFSLHDVAGGEPGSGYSSNPVFYDDNTGVYLHSEDWLVRDLELVFYDHTTKEITTIKLFD